MVSLPVAMVAAVALLLQVAVAPGVFAAPQNALLAICHAATDDHAPQPLSGHDHEHCAWCRVGPVAFLLPPPMLLLPVPAAALVSAVRVAGDLVRGAGRLAYASRAPPAIG
jgi:hypothetical protein